MLRFYLDEHVADAIASALRKHEIDIQTAVEAKMAGHKVPDPIQLSWASIHQRTFVTGDWDFLQYGATVHPHLGVIIIPRSVSLGFAIEYLLLLGTGYQPEDVANRIIVFPNI
jgi:hypothetical protein